MDARPALYSKPMVGRLVKTVVIASHKLFLLISPFCFCKWAHATSDNRSHHGLLPFPGFQATMRGVSGTLATTHCLACLVYGEPDLPAYNSWYANLFGLGMIGEFLADGSSNEPFARGAQHCLDYVGMGGPRRQKQRQSRFRSLLCDSMSSMSYYYVDAFKCKRLRIQTCNCSLSES